MSFGLALNDSRIKTSGLGHNRSINLERLVIPFFSVGAAGSCVALYTYEQALRSLPQADKLLEGMVIDAPRPPAYYIAHAIEITLLLLAGLIALIGTNPRTIERGYILKFGLFIGACLLMTARSYTFSDLLSTKLADQHGPVPFLLSLLVFVGARRSNWAFLEKLIATLALLFSVLVIIRIAGLQTFTRSEAVVNLTGTLNVLYWPAGWFVLRQNLRRGLVGLLRFVPILIYSLGSLFTQTRLNFVMIFCLCAVYAFLQKKRRCPQGLGWASVLTLALWLGLFTAIFLRDTATYTKIESVTEAFQSRLDEDTRTGQLVDFAADVPWQDLILGRGSFGTWQWGNILWGGVDLGYVTLLFCGGIPLLFTYVWTQLMPCLTVFRNSSTDLQLSAAGLVLLWCVIMFSSAYPSIDVGNYTISLCIGACISRDREYSGQSVSSLATPG